ncbi:DEAD/DEAH box helicase [Enorma massiliensis]|uniref:DEAD/DEAH box helicase n=1 Tax=Enorma massiliensis TaxID=1472761 RepID=A0A1Y3UFQ6_9ACTN|nr:DEAD/DEAH box helicase [Enorma massiliensis]OUN44210.1 DEAD/DEAH box helicase [Enorma massiliensis]
MANTADTANASAAPTAGSSASSFAAGTGSTGEHGSLGALSPSWWEPAEGEEPEPWCTADEAFERFLGWCDERGIELWEHQEEALMDLAAGDHVILGTPTGSGKSLVALGMLFLGMAQGRRAYYTAPIKALVSEKFFDLVEVLGRDNVGMITGDTHINTQAPVICCTAEILANQALREGEDTDVGVVAMDEFHYFADPDRGWAWQVPLLTLPHTQFMLMSATLGDVTQIADALEERTGRIVDRVTDAPRPVPLAYEYVDTALEGTVELALRRDEAPLYIVHFSQDAVLATAQSLANFGIATKEQREAVKEAAKGTHFTTAFGKILKRLISNGVGVHHAGMLPRYRLLVERLAQQGLLPVICGTDTLGVGINVPIHTVVLTALTKFDGYKMRRLRAREFHQIAGRAGRAGFDTEGMVIAEAPEYEIENAKLIAKAGDDPKKLRKLKKKKPPEGFVTWNKQTFERLCEAVPETLKPRLRITNSMVLSMVERGGDARVRVSELIEASLQTPEEKLKLEARASEIFATLIDTGVVVRDEVPDGADAPGGTSAPSGAGTSSGVDAPDGADAPGGTSASTDAAPRVEYSLTVDLPEDFALDQPLSPFLLAALELLDPESETYTFDLISMVEATLEDPKQVLRAQERQARDTAMAAMKADGVEYEERLERLQDITYPKPLEDLLDSAFAQYCTKVPWAADYELSPKSVLRDMLESAADFKGYIQKLGIARSEGILLRYLAEAFRSLDRTVPLEKRNDQLNDIISWLGFVVRSVDSSLVDEWAAAGEDSAFDAAPPSGADVVVADRRGMTLLVRNALFRRVSLAARERADELGELDEAWGMGELRWRRALDAFFEAHEELLVDGDARSTAFFTIDESDELKPAAEGGHVWHVHQIFHDSDGDHDFGIMADVDLDATQEESEAVFKNYRVGFIEELLEQG